ncbi:MAG: molybdenum cofactor guanylyltransferase MobA [Hyphomicrobiales bacterium]|nr:molybdenum cofactor guanylyltransferase MobA [Hyphomicrobiales bacterium]
METVGGDVVGVVLAGGLSRRMGGGDKGLLDLAGASLIARVIERLRPQVGAMVVNANGDPARLARFGLPIAPDATADFAGPLSGVLAGMAWAREHRPAARWVATAACDTPFFPETFVADCLAAVGERHTAIALAASSDGAHPVFGLWPTALAGDLERALERGVRKVLDWTNAHPTVEVRFGPVVLPGGHADPFFNANTPADLAEAERLLRGV